MTRRRRYSRAGFAAAGVFDFGRVGRSTSEMSSVASILSENAVSDLTIFELLNMPACVEEG